MDPKDLTQGMMAGAVVGYRLGADLRDRLQANADHAEAEDAIRQWKEYSENLSRELHLAKLRVANGENSVAIRDEAIQELGDLAKKLEVETIQLNRLLVQRDAELNKLREEYRNLEEANGVLYKKSRQLRIQKDFLDQDIIGLKQDNAKLKASSQTNGAQAAAYAGLFDLLAGEVARSSKPDSFKDMTPSLMRKTYQEAYLGFRQSGKLVYEPDFDYAHQIDKKIKEEESKL